MKSSAPDYQQDNSRFAPSRGRELKSFGQLEGLIPFVRPLAGAGIEIHAWDTIDKFDGFAPSRGRELKYVVVADKMIHVVRPLAGAGIEISGSYRANPPHIVRPLAGAGIEKRLPP